MVILAVFLYSFMQRPSIHPTLGSPPNCSSLLTNFYNVHALLTSAVKNKIAMFGRVSVHLPVILSR